MKSKQIARISATVFAIIVVLHLIRSVLGWPAIIANLKIPISVSLIAVIIAGYLSYENWKAAK